MMSSTRASRLFASHNNGRSVYEAIQEDENAAQPRYQDDELGNSLDEQNLDAHFQDQDLDQLIAEAAESEIDTNPAASIAAEVRSPRESRTQPQLLQRKPKWMQQDSYRPPNEDQEDDEEIEEEDTKSEGRPDDLLLEDVEGHEEQPREQDRDQQRDRLPSPVPGPSSRKPRVKWAAEASRESAESNHRRDFPTSESTPPAISQIFRAYHMASPREKAMWKWVNVENLDDFLHEVYGYFLGKGFWSIILARVLQQLNLAFVVWFISFLTMCVDYKLIPESTRLSEVLVPKCTTRMPAIINLLIWGFVFYWIIQSALYALDVKRLWNMHEFYEHLLGISEVNMQTVTWQEIVGRLMALRDANPQTALNFNERNRKFIGANSRQRMDAHDIANRLMRRENYFIALFNKDVLNLNLPVPVLRNRQMFSRNLEWNIKLSVMDFVFDDKHQVRPIFLRDSHRKELIEALKRRLRFYGLVNIVTAPFLVAYYLSIFFFENFAEFRQNPSAISSRDYTPLALWKFREFNELPHQFARRRDLSRPFASHYIDQFPKDKMMQMARFVGFIASSIVSVLAVATLLDPELFLGFEITHNRTVLFYSTVLLAVWTATRGIVGDPNFVFDPNHAMKDVISFTHYCPSFWKDRLHTEDVRLDFSRLYQTKVIIFFEEILSMITTPFMLYLSLPECSERIVDFYREFTVHVDGMGAVCSFALFDFQKADEVNVAGPGAGGPSYDGAQDPESKKDRLTNDYYSTKDDKMLSSYYSFLDNYAPGSRRPGAPMPPSQRTLYSGLAAREGGRGLRTRSMDPTSRASSRSRPGLNHRSTAIYRPDEHTSPPQSLLLDPHHQPTNVPHLEQLPEEPDIDPDLLQSLPPRPTETGMHTVALSPQIKASIRQQPAMSSTAMLAQDSRIGESWRMDRERASTFDPDQRDLESAIDPATGDQEGGAGVLGLLYQYQKAQTERGPAGGKM